MTQPPPIEFHHEIRQSSIILIIHIIIVELIMIFFHIILWKLIIAFGLHGASGFGLSAMTWETIIFHSINIVVVLTIVAMWTYVSYTLTPWTVSFTSGVFYKNRTSFNISHIESVSVKQGIFGRIFDYGTVQIKSPYYDTDISLKRIPSPQHLAQTIENQRLYESSLDSQISDVTYFKKS